MQISRPLKLAALLCMPFFVIAAAIYPVSSWSEAWLKTNIQWLRWSQFLSPQHTIGLELQTADAYQQFHARTSSALLRQIKAQLSAAAAAPNTDTEHRYQIFARQLISRHQSWVSRSAELLLIKAELELLQQQTEQALQSLTQAHDLINKNQEEYDTVVGEVLGQRCQLEQQLGLLSASKLSCEQYYQWTEQGRNISIDLKAQAALLQGLNALHLQQTHQAKEWFSQALSLLEGQQKQFPMLTIKVLQADALALHDLGNFAMAGHNLEQAYQLYQEAMLNDVLLEVELLTNLATHFNETGLYQQGYDAAKKAKTLYQQELNNNLPLAVAISNLLGSFAQDLGQFAEAFQHYQDALQSLQQAFPKAHPDTAAVLNNLGSLSNAVANQEQAKIYYQQALTMRRELFGEHHLEVFATENNLALVYTDLNETSKAIELFEKTHAKLQASEAKDHPLAEVLAVNLARSYLDVGDPRAGALLKDSIATQQKRYGASHPKLLPTLIGLIDFYQQQKSWLEAEMLSQRALNIAQTSLPEHHSDIATCLFKLARTYHLAGDLAKAEQYYQKELIILQHNQDVAGQQGTLKRLIELFDERGDAAKSQAIKTRLAELNERG